MSLWEVLKSYTPQNEQEQRDKVQMLKFMEKNENCLERENLAGHFTASVWTVNQERTKTLMAYHRIYDSWAWLGGHADGEEDLRKVALKELQEETGVQQVKMIGEEPLSLETLVVNGHVKRGCWVPSHLHFNLTYLAEVSEEEPLRVKEDENSAVAWWTAEEALKQSTEPWMVEYVYKKLIERSKKK